MDHNAPISGLDDLDRHLDALLALPSNAPPTATPASVRFDPALFDTVELQLTEGNIPALIPRLLPKIVGVLQNPVAVGSEANAGVLSSIAIKLLGPVSFRDALTLASEANLVAALGADAAPATNVLAMTVVHKASGGSNTASQRRAGAAEDITRLSTMNALLSALVVRWLASPAVEVGECGSRVIGDLLDVDCPLPPVRYTATQHEPGRGINGSLSGIATTTIAPPSPLRTRPGQGQLWNRLLHDPAFYRDVLVALCRGTHPETSGNTHQQSIAQGRVLRLVPRLAALNLAAVAAGSESLLQFVALQMVDTSDVLMHLSMVDFYETLVSVLRVAALARRVSSAATGSEDSGNNVDYTIEVLRTLLRTATAQDPELLQSLQSLPDRTVPEEADELRDWLRQILPASATRVSGWQ
ncbi:uncharacterized protein SPSK_07611 [Sporothrix schenckii 1099-18]|uniref:DNA mismatch repair protein HSM3 N-terminal domain-containing protein n=1 Tax=Sporothrix schenckii 1099-18 TaxID=1397361 RepID=A0A0F2MF49_SPOSC|nr:uncharacterized protein SPSK_07611 [Sporothrix schenckii 1099-18]KJR88323.1 hypothetical protein SPSK_07611 [Sporothrix schenckii 1099-18]